MKRTAFLPLAILAGCDAPPPASSPPYKSFGNLPISGSLADAHRASFTQCIELTTGLRCRRSGVMIERQGPYSAAVDLARRDGSGGFTELTFWHDDDQSAVINVGKELEQYGWQACMTGGDGAGDQKVWTLKGAPVRFSMDISYWGKRRMRIIPDDGNTPRPCKPQG